MKKYLRYISFFLILVTLLCSFAACANDSGNGGGSGDSNKQKITLTVWGSQEDQDLLREMCDAFAKANPQNDYEFLYGVQGENEVADRVLNDVTAGPDVYTFISDQIYKLYAGGALARVGGDLEKAVKSENSEGSVDASIVEINGEKHLYAYPATGDNCFFVYYDKRVYTDPSDLTTLDSMLDTAETAGKKIHFKLNDDGWHLSSFFFADPDLKYDVTYNENMKETAVKINFDTEDGLEVMKALRTYINRDGFVVQTDDSKMLAALTPDKNGRSEAAAIISGTWNAAAVEKILGDNMGVCKLPTVKIGGENVQLSGFMGYKLVGVNGYSKNKGEAHKLAAWLTNEQNQQRRFEVRGFGPTNKKVFENEAVKNDPVISTVIEQSQYNRTQKGVPSNYWTPMASLITPLVTAKSNGTKVTDAQLREYLDALCKQIRK